jgi:hypothetical protein
MAANASLPRSVLNEREDEKNATEVVVSLPEPIAQKLSGRDITGFETRLLRFLEALSLSALSLFGKMFIITVSGVAKKSKRDHKTTLHSLVKS